MKKKFQEEKRKEKTPGSKENIRGKKITLRFDKEHYKFENMKERKSEDLKTLFKRMKEKGNLDEVDQKKTITLRKKTQLTKKIRGRPALKAKIVKEIIRRFEGNNR